MADVDFDDFDGAYGSGWQDPLARSRVARVVHLAGAVCSVAIVLGVIFWGYRIAVRDVHGVPVIQAMSGPMRIAPENPGGEVADHQGLAVNTVAALGTAAPPPDRLVLAPRPVELSYEDAPGLALEGALPAMPEAAVAASGVLSLAAPDLAEPVLQAPAETTGPDPDAVALALAEALAEPVPEAPLTDDGVDLAAADTTAIRPRARPGSEGGAAGPVSLSEPEAQPAVMAEIDPSMIPAGTRLVQLGAFDSAEQARAEWLKLGNQFGPLLDGKALVVQAAESGGRTFFRLRAHGFADEVDARGFCTQILAQNASCIPVEQR